jgi:predicted nucleic acid-binding Zn ribbon protein
LTGPVRRRPPGPDAGPRAIGSLLEPYARRLGPVGAESLGALFARWEDIVGPAMAAHVSPVRLNGATLVVQADHPGWATQVRHLADEVLTRVGETVGPPAPTHLEVRIRPPTRA